MATEMHSAEVYDYLKHLVPPDTAAGAVPAMTVCKYTGSFDESHMFHGKGVLHSTMGFCYDGDFVHGRMQGRGHMVWHSGLTFTGDFHANAPSGSGVLSWPNGDRYSGSVRRGVRDGRGTLTTPRGAYAGAWADGRREGRGRQSYAGGDVYDGEWFANRRHGRGRMAYAAGDVYDGEWFYGERHGRGAMGWRRGGEQFVEVYDGAWRNGVPHGSGRATYVGDFAAAQRKDAERTEACDTASPATFAPPVAAVVNVYEGEWVDGKREGCGIFYYADGSVYEGEWSAGAKNGRGRVTTSAGATAYIANTSGADADAWMHAFVESSDRLPVVTLHGILGVADGTPEEAAAALRLQLLQHNNTLRALFDACAARCDGVALAVATPVDWWRRRLPGHVALPQLLRMLADAQLLNGRVALRDAVACVAATIQHEADADRDSPSDAEPQSVQLRKLLADIPRFAGALNFRQFVETLVRLAAIAVTGPGAACGVAGKFAALVEGPLARVHAPAEPAAPLCPATAKVDRAIAPRLARIESLFARLATRCAGGEGALVPARRAAMFARAFLERRGVGATSALTRAMPFDRFAAGGAAPPGICAPRNALGQELYRRSCGARGELAAVCVADERMLTFVEFVELIVEFAEMTGEEDEVVGRLDELLDEPTHSKEDAPEQKGLGSSDASCIDEGS